MFVGADEGFRSRDATLADTEKVLVRLVQACDPTGNKATCCAVQVQFLEKHRDALPRKPTKKRGKAKRFFCEQCGDELAFEAEY